MELFLLSPAAGGWGRLQCECTLHGFIQSMLYTFIVILGSAVYVRQPPVLDERAPVVRRFSTVSAILYSLLCCPRTLYRTYFIPT